MIWRTGRLLAILAGALTFSALCAKADEIDFSGDQPGPSGGVVVVIQGADHGFSLTDAPLDNLTIDGTPTGSFAGDLSIQDVLGDTTDSSGDLLFNGGTLTISSGSTDLVTAQLLGSALGPTSVGGVYDFLAVLDPDNTTFGGILAPESPLIEGIGDTVQIIVPVLEVDGAIIGGGTELGSKVVLVTPEPSTIGLLGLGLAGLLIMRRRRSGVTDFVSR